jgi:hypothetical protein
MSFRCIWVHVVLGVAMSFLSDANLAGTAASNEIVAPITGALDSFRAGDKAAFVAAWAARGVEIIDDVPPYLWTGERALHRWLDDTAKVIDGLHLENLDIRAQTPLRVEAAGDHAYVVLPVVVTYRRDGKDYRQDGTQVLVMTNTKAGWKILSMSYAGGLAEPRQ